MGDVDKVFEEVDRFLDRRIGIKDEWLRKKLNDPLGFSDVYDRAEPTPTLKEEPLPTELDLTAATDALYKKLRKRRTKSSTKATQGVYGDIYSGQTLIPL